MSRKIPFSTAVIMSMNVMIGAGLYAGASKMSAVAGNAAFIGWIVVALLYLPIVYSVSRIASLVPETGGFYRYAYTAFGQVAGFFNGWLYFLAYLCTTAVLIGLFRENILSIFPNSMIVQNRLLFSVLAMAAIAALNLVDMSLIGRIQKNLTIAKILPVIILFALLPFFLGKGFHISASELMQSFSPNTWTMALFGFFGFEFACQLSNQIEDGEKKTPKVVLTAFGSVTAIYALFTFGLLQIMGAENLTKLGAGGFPWFIGTKFPFLINPISFIISSAITILFFNSTNGLLTVTVAQINSMASSGLMRGSRFLALKNRANRPWVLIAILSTLIIFLNLFIPNQILTLTTIIGIIATYAITCLSLLAIQMRNKTGALGLILTTIGIAASCGLVYSQFIQLGTWDEKILLLSPLVVGLIIGALIMKPAHKV